MDTSTQRTLLLFEKLLSAEIFLLALASILFADAYLLMFHGLTVFSLGISIKNVEVTVSQSAIFVLAYSAFFGVVSPFCAASIDMIMIRLKSTSKKRLIGYVNIERIKQDAINEQNPFMYKHYETVMGRLQKATSVRKLSIAILILLLVLAIASLVRADGAAGGLFEAAWKILADNGAAPASLRILAFFAAIAAFSLAINPTSDIFNSEYLPAYGYRLQKEWLEEIKVGLVDKDMLLSHLRLVAEDAFQGAKYNPSNKSHAYCVKHRLARTIEGKLTVSEKGDFFKLFID